MKSTWKKVGPASANGVVTEFANAFEDRLRAMGRIRKRLWMGVFLMSLAVAARAGNGELIIFTGDPASAVTQDFQKRFLPQVRDLARAQGVTLIEKSIEAGAPADVVFTPGIYFQNHLGRSLYLGRYHSMDKLKTFIRTVSRLPQASTTHEKHDVLVRKLERATLCLPVKITDLGGAVPKGHAAEKFHRQALQALAKGASDFALKATHLARRNDRAVYLALYPYLGTDGKFFVSAEMYSQFNCIKPLRQWFQVPFEGTWKHWEQVFEAAGKELQAEVGRQLASTENGDGMIPVPASVTTMTWEELGLPLPKAPEGAAITTQPTVLLGKAWTFAGPVEPEVPILSFHFMQPVDNYAGEVLTLFGDLNLSDGPSIQAATGKFGIEINTLTMGDPGLNEHIYDMLGIDTHPKAWFTFQDIKPMEDAGVAFGRVNQFSVSGQLEFMGIHAPLQVTAEMEPVLDDAGAPRIRVLAAFNLRIKEKYGLKGPDGPQPAVDTMEFELNFLLKPAA
jgi:hypothetical protein